MVYIKYEINGSVLSILYEISSTNYPNDVYIKMVLEVLDTGTMYKHIWTSDTIPTINNIFNIDLELAIDAIKQKPDCIKFSDLNAICNFSINLGSHKHSISYILPRTIIEGEPDGQSDKLRVLTRRVKTLEDTYIINPNLKSINSLNEIAIPKTYQRISKQFPHLNLEEIIDFEKKVIKNGGSIQVHNGQFILTDRPSGSSYNSSRNNMTHPDMSDAYISWNCCLHLNKLEKQYEVCRGYKHNKRGLFTNKLPFNPKHPGDLQNRDPNSPCTWSITFHLYEYNEKTIDIANVKVSEASINIKKNIDLYRNTITDLTKEINRLNSINESLLKIAIN